MMDKDNLGLTIFLLIIVAAYVIGFFRRRLQRQLGRNLKVDSNQLLEIATDYLEHMKGEFESKYGPFQIHTKEILLECIRKEISTKNIVNIKGLENYLKGSFVKEVELHLRSQKEFEES